MVLGNHDLQPFAIDRAVKSRALAALERARLIDIARRQGTLPTITLLDIDPKADAVSELAASHRSGRLGAARCRMRVRGNTPAQSRPSQTSTRAAPRD